MYEEEEENSENETQDEADDNFALEGKRWADGGFSYGFNAASASVDFLRQKSRKALKKISSLTQKDSSSRPNSAPQKGKPSEKAKVDEDFSTGTLCPVSEDVIAIHNRTHIKFVFLRTRKSRLLVPANNQGVGVIGGRDDLSVLAWSDIGPPSPKVHVYRYSQPLDIITLEGTFLRALSKNFFCLVQVQHQICMYLIQGAP